MNKKKMHVRIQANARQGITLIALIITIIVMLILVAVTINMVVNGGLFEKAGQAVRETQNEINAEQELADGRIQINEVWYDSIDDYINDKPSLNQGEKRTIKVESTQTEGEELWNSTVTLKISLEEETNLTLEQKRNIAAFMLDCSSYEEFKNFIENYVADGSSYEQIVDEEEETFLDAVIDIMKNFLSFKEPHKLENLGIKVISVKTPYNTTLYTTSLGGDIECTFVKNGSYIFTIQSGASQVIETVKVNNIRSYDDQGPHDVKVDFIGSQESLMYKIDDLEEWNNVSSTTLNCNNSISYKLNSIGTWVNYVIKDEQYYKYFSNDDEWILWNTNWSLFLRLGNYNNLSWRQIMFYNMNIDVNGTLLLSDGEWADYMDEFYIPRINGETIDEGKLLEKYPKAGIGVNKFLIQMGNIKSINFTKDTNICVFSDYWD